MAFQPEQPIAPIHRGYIKIELFIPRPVDPIDQQQASLQVQIVYSDSSTRQRSYDLLERLQDDAEGQTHLSNLAALKTYILARIDTELLV